MRLLPFAIYLAGLSAQEQWLEDCVSRRPGTPGAWATRAEGLFRAALAYSRREYDSVLTATEADLSALDGATTGPAAMVLSWVHLWRARAMAAQGLLERALTESQSAWVVGQRDLLHDPSMGVHLSLLVAELAEATGRDRDVLVATELAGVILDSYVDRSWDQYRQKRAALLERIAMSPASVPGAG